MNKMIFYLCFCLFLTSCSPIKPKKTEVEKGTWIKIAEQAAFKLLEPRLFGFHGHITQVVTATYSQKQVDFIAQIEIDQQQNTLVFVAVSTLGLTLFKITMKENKIEFSGLKPVLEQLDPRQLLASLQLSLSPLVRINTSLKSAKLSVKKNKEGELRQLFSDNQLVMKIKKSNTWAVDQEIQIIHYHPLYQINIKTIDLIYGI